jgi:hypothetical protein
MLKGESHVATEHTRVSCWNYHLLASWSPILSLLAIMTQASVDHVGPHLPIQGNFCAPFGSFTSSFVISMVIPLKEVRERDKNSPLRVT